MNSKILYSSGLSIPIMHMGKLKTAQAVSKRFKITKNKKIMKKRAGQDHFNSREPGKVTRHKRRGVAMSKVFEKNIRRFITHN